VLQVELEPDDFPVTELRSTGLAEPECSVEFDCASLIRSRVEDDTSVAVLDSPGECRFGEPSPDALPPALRRDKYVVKTGTLFSDIDELRQLDAGARLGTPDSRQADHSLAGAVLLDRERTYSNSSVMRLMSSGIGSGLGYVRPHGGVREYSHSIQGWSPS
jgi:hypothetical protein